MCTLQKINRRINMLHFEALSRIGKNTAKTLNVARWAAELTDMLESKGVAASIFIGYKPTLLVELPENMKPNMEGLWQIFQTAGLENWLSANKLKYYGANGEYGGCIRIEPKDDRMGMSDITLDIAVQIKK